MSSDQDGQEFSASFSTIYAMFADSQDDIYMACETSVRKMDASTNVTTIAGSFTQSGYVGNHVFQTRLLFSRSKPEKNPALSPTGC
jgi:hypothetical protein